MVLVATKTLNFNTGVFIILGLSKKSSKLRLAECSWTQTKKVHGISFAWNVKLRMQ
jgi:hypothetical protein